MGKIWKPNTTMNIPFDLLNRVSEFLKNNPRQFLNQNKQNSRNVLIEKALTYYMDHWEEIKKVAA